ncbi:thymidylate kinase [Mytilinidion resinicola]|uniref:Thymidylate kinase n=1 Tax=Mytilinidion resinicola TaxID=574789 RepID=A0A6A6XYV7_9PEZI|nr:thymidylate kinase [Mytilinidion resinicola]KAF2801600.1 thymidylate kinase [Mytilinidion resinicola]
MRGKLIVFEGLDRAGKSTQCNRLVESLQSEGMKVRYLRFPDRTTPIGQMINNYLTNQSEQEDHVIHLLFSANRWEAAASIQADIAAGTTVVIDRYYYSGCVYSAAKDIPALDLAWARHPEEGLPRPDVCVFLDISVEEAAKRGGYGGEKYEVQEMQDRVRGLFAVLRESAEKDDFVRIEGGGSFEDVQKNVRQAVGKAMEKVDGEGLPLRFVQPW